jgi:hypothetical protein
MRLFPPVETNLGVVRDKLKDVSALRRNFDGRMK